jgi:hypothetical protein
MVSGLPAIADVTVLGRQLTVSVPTRVPKPALIPPVSGNVR